MEDAKTINEKTSARIIQMSLIGAAFVGICLLFLLMFVWFQPDQLSLSDRYFPSPTATQTQTPSSTPTATFTPSATPTYTPTLTATMTPTPHLLLAPPQDVIVRTETFDESARTWNAYYSNTTVRVKDGKLLLKSNETGYIGIAICSGCTYEQILYLQAELLLEKNLPIEHGLAFCASSLDDNFYTFLINQSYSSYSLLKHKRDSWDTLISNQSTDVINKYPASNTVSVYFDQGKMNMYINDQLVDSFIDTEPLKCSWAGIVIDNGTLNLMVDNIFTYTMKPAATPTP